MVNHNLYYYHCYPHYPHHYHYHLPSLQPFQLSFSVSLCLTLMLMVWPWPDSEALIMYAPVSLYLLSSSCSASCREIFPKYQLHGKRNR